MTSKGMWFLDKGVGGRDDENVMKLYEVLCKNSVTILKIIEVYN